MGNNPTFTNTYKAASTTVNITAKKVLNGKTLKQVNMSLNLKKVTKVTGTATNARRYRLLSQVSSTKKLVSTLHYL